MQTDYQLQQFTTRFGDLTLTIEGLVDFDQAVDHVYAVLTARGEAERLTELCPFFGKLWPSARGLAARLASGPSLHGLRVLEVGCGLALPGLVAARRGALVTVSDCHPEVPTFLRRNLMLNDAAQVTYVEADWRNPNVFLGVFDLVLGSDVLYEREHPRLLADFVERHLAPNGQIWISDPGRAFLQDFAREAERRGFVTNLAVEPVVDADVAEVYVLTFMKPAQAVHGLVQ